MDSLLLINPPSPFLINDAVFPPLGLLYLAGAVNAKVVDLAIDNHIPRADVYGITATTPQINKAIAIAETLDGIKILGGAHISGTKTLPDGFDIGVIGPGEKVLLMDTIPNGLVEGSFMPTKPNRNAIDLHNYQYYIDDILATTMMTSFGCPFQCAFCSKPVFGKHTYYQSFSMIKQEIDDIKELGYEAVMIFDDNFLLHPQARQISHYLHEQSFIYRCFVQTRFISENVANWLASTGCKEVGIGIESGSDRILKIINKPATVKENIEVIRILKRNNIRVKGFFIIGLPSENKESISETERFLADVGLDDIDITIFTPYPSSKFWSSKLQNYDDYWYKGRPGEYHSSVHTETLSFAEIVEARNFLESKFKAANV